MLVSGGMAGWIAHPPGTMLWPAELCLELGDMLRPLHYKCHLLSWVRAAYRIETTYSIHCFFHSLHCFTAPQFA